MLELAFFPPIASEDPICLLEFLISFAEILDLHWSAVDMVARVAMRSGSMGVINRLSLKVFP